MAKAEKRIYIVKLKAGGAPERLINGLSKAQAIRHVAADLLTVEVAKQSDLVRLLPTVKVEEATEPDQEKLPIPTTA